MPVEKMERKSLRFEQGPIRPPNEARSLLLRLTRNCPWNHCLFCPVYKSRKFSLRSVDEIKQDIIAARNMIDRIETLSHQMGTAGRVDDRVISQIFNDSDNSSSFRSVAGWLYYGTGACFLQDADNLIIPTEDLIEVLNFLKNTIPSITRVTTYARSKTVLKKSAASLERIREAGLDRIHIGLESGCDEVLKLMKKGVTGKEHINAGKRVRAAGISLSEYVMPGLGGQEMWQAHAEDTAAVLNAINPDFIRLRSLRVPRRVPLSAKVTDETFTLMTDDMVADEIYLFVSRLEGIESRIASDHIMNLLPDVHGKLPDDKNRMLDAIDAYRTLSSEDRLIYRVGRRGGSFQSIYDLKQDSLLYGKIKGVIEQVKADKGASGVERFVTEMVDQYI